MTRDGRGPSSQRRRVLRSLGGLGLAGFAAASRADEFPSRPIRIVASTTPGTAVDVMARWLAPRLSSELGTSVIVENKVGANGIIAATDVAKSAADGYTLLATAANHYANRWTVASLPFDPVADFTPVARTGTAYLVLVVPASAPYDTLRGLLDHLRATQGQTMYSSAGNGSTTQLTTVVMMSMAGVSATHVPYKGAAQALSDTAGGQVALTFAGISTALPYLKAGRLKALGVSGPRRSQSLPDVPTLAEAGLPGYDVTTFMGFFGPKGLPPPIARKLSEVLTRLAATADYREFCALQGIEPDRAGTEVFAAEAPAEMARWGKIIALSGAKPQ